jgi:hypothetical protein
VRRCEAISFAGYAEGLKGQKANPAILPDDGVKSLFDETTARRSRPDLQSD